MSQLSAGLAAALAADRVVVFGAVRLALPGATVRLLDGSGVVVFGGETYTGEDAIFGSLGTISSLSDGQGDEAPAFDISLIPPGATAAATLASAAMQGSSVQLWLGAIDRATGLTLGDPYLAFAGEIDVPVVRAGADGRRVEYQVVSATERLFQEDEGAKLSDSFHQSIWPGETSFFDVTGIEQTIYWGQAPVASNITVGGGRSFAAGDAVRDQ